MSRADKRQRERARRQRRAERVAQQKGVGVGGSARGRNESAADPVKGATVELIDDTLSWHLARTQPLLGSIGRRSLDEALIFHSVRAFRPRASEVVIRRGRRVVRHVPLLIRTLIIGVRDEEHLDTVAGLPWVSEIVSQPAPDTTLRGNVEGMVMKPARLDPKLLQVFITALADNEVVRPVGIGVGEAVRMLNGPFASFPGVVEEILPNDRVKVAVAIFGRPSPVVMGIADVAKA